FAVLEAPEDNEIAELQFSDWKVEIPSLAVYTPVVYAYNKYGKLINADYKDYSLECPAGLGEIINDGHSLMSSEASTSGVLTVTSANGIKASVNVFLTGVKDIRAKYETVVLNKTRKWDAELVTTYVGNTTMPLAARTMSWTSEDASVATVTPEGLVTPVANGETVITGVRGEITVNINVKVQIAGSEVAPADRLMRVADWKTTNIGMASVSLTPNENGTNVDYVIKSPRGARISVLPEADIFSHPQSVRVRLNPGTAKVTDVTITLKANNAIGVVSKKFTDVKADETNVYEMPVADYFDVSDIGIYPIRFVSVAMGIGGKTKTDYHVEIPGIEAVYDESTLSVNDIKADDNDNADSRFFNIDGDTVTVSAPADIVIVDAAGRTIAAYSGVTAVTLPKGVAVVSATTADGIVHALKVVR
ncbi:MAG: Ig-like domain-containing protein, partial [Bacteroidales bacterium]|nr:Ig-like domain-containing protein [Bacteroidales bacterium]